MALKQLASVQLSNVDKLSEEGEEPVLLCNYVDVYKHDFIRAGHDFMQATAKPGEIERFELREGDVLITKDSETWDDIGVPALIVEDLPGVLCGYHLAMLRPHSGIAEGAYLYWALESRVGALQFHTAATGVTRFGISKADIKNVVVPLPTLPEQRAIARYLAHAQRQVARLIRNKRRLIALLNEEKQAIIQQAVTRGLDPDVAMKPSGVEWLGEIAAHWRTVRLGRHIQITTGFPFKSEGFSLADTDIRLLRGVNVAVGRIRWDSVVSWPTSQRDQFADYELRVGDIVLGMDRPVISGGVRVARVQFDDVPSLLLQRVARLRPHGDLDPEFLLLLLAGPSFSDYIAPIFTGISVPHLSPEQIGDFRFALPDPEEQAAIVKHVKNRTEAISAAIERANCEIDLIREYRTRLIADVVTGQLDVREAAAALPDIEEEESGAALDIGEAMEEGEGFADDEFDPIENADAAD